MNYDVVFVKKEVKHLHTFKLLRNHFEKTEQKNVINIKYVSLDVFSMAQSILLNIILTSLILKITLH